MPFENLTGDRSLDWTGRGVQLALNRQLSPSKTVAVLSYNDLTDAELGRATRILHGSIERRAQLLRLQVMQEDASTHQQVGDRIELRVPPEQLLVAVNELAHKLAADASAAPTNRPEALAALVDAQQQPQPEAKATALARAAQLDPQFALPLIGLAELSVGTGQRQEVEAALAATATRQMNEVERQQVALLKANVSVDRAAQVQALQKLSEAAPSQPVTQALVGSLLSRLHQFAPSITAYERALKVDPENADVWNRLGYTNAYLGRLPAAREALERYQQLAPAEPNPLDSLGEVHYMGAQFKLAGDYFQATFGKSPQFEGARSLLKSAYARLLDGQFSQADSAFAQYAKATEGSPATEIARAHWLYTSGQPEAAVAALTDAAAKSTGPLASIYQTHRCGLLLRTDRAAAQAAARAAISSGPAPVALLCGFLSQPSATPAEWTARVERAFNSPQAAGFRRQALAYALFFDGHYAEAFPLIETLTLESNPDADSELRVFLAECQWRTGRWASARETLARWPLPAPDSIFAGQHVPSYVMALLKTGEHFDDNAAAKRWTEIAKRMARSLK